MSAQRKIRTVYNETQRRPMTTHGNDEILQEILQLRTVMAPQNQQYTSNDVAIVELTKNQQRLESQIANLLNICEQIGESVIEVKDKLSQYDIDGDVSDAENFGDDDADNTDNENELNQSLDETHNENEDGEVAKGTNDTGVGITVPENDAENNAENIEHTKSKRKYTKRKK